MTSFGSVSALESGIRYTSSQGSGSRDSFHDDSICRGFNAHTFDQENFSPTLVSPPQLSQNASPCRRCGQNAMRRSRSFPSEHFSFFGTRSNILGTLATVVNL